MLLKVQKKTHTQTLRVILYEPKNKKEEMKNYKREISLKIFAYTTRMRMMMMPKKYKSM